MHSARALWVIYVILTAACAVTFYLLGMTPFDAICHAMSTLATGGFSTHDASIGYFHSLGIEIAAMAFMLIGASNFALHYLAWSNSSLAQYWRNTEFREFLAIYALLGSTVCATLYFCSSRSEEHTSDIQSLMRISYADSCLTQKQH